mgnify:FL=1
MARIYSRKKGKSGSKKPIKKVKPTWVTYDAKTVEQLVVKLAKTGKTSSEIGLVLRDTYGIPDVMAITKKNITKMLSENKLSPNIPYDLKALIRKGIIIMKHLETNKHDVPSLRGLILTESKIKRLVKYYKYNKILPEGWVYNRSKAKVLAE